MKNILLLILLIPMSSHAQKFISDQSNVRFYSSAPIEDIEAINEKAKSVIDLGNGQVVFSVDIEGFEFKKDLMKEHFNENYLESEKYPKSTFKGGIEDWNNVKGKQEVTVKGDLMIHGITKKATLKGSIDVLENQVKVESVFIVKLVDYKIKIPKAVFYNIAEEIEVTVKFDYKPYGK
ncbi:MAG: polyisoprenoid-binding protein YceI [Cyclobacteriaceae bacterium]|jgi:polyisoprenoid-binding protein YceI